MSAMPLPLRASDAAIDAMDRRIIVASQAGLPLVPQPYRALAARVGLDEEEVMRRLRRLLERDVIRRIAAVPNHYALGYRANGMTVWDVDDAAIAELGPRVGLLEFVSHCYRRPRRAPHWPYNLFAMVHGGTREQVAEHVGRIAAILGGAARSSDVLYSSRILKKTGLRLGGS
jgi:DNA-binding Lrp family transcriptional regulator